MSTGLTLTFLFYSDPLNFLYSLNDFILLLLFPLLLFPLSLKLELVDCKLKLELVDGELTLKLVDGELEFVHGELEVEHNVSVKIL